MSIHDREANAPSVKREVQPGSIESDAVPGTEIVTSDVAVLVVVVDSCPSAAVVVVES